MKLYSYLVLRFLASISALITLGILMVPTIINISYNQKYHLKYLRGWVVLGGFHQSFTETGHPLVLLQMAVW